MARPTTPIQNTGATSAVPDEMSGSAWPSALRVATKRGTSTPPPAAGASRAARARAPAPLVVWVSAGAPPPGRRGDPPAGPPVLHEPVEERHHGHDPEDGD